MKQKNTVKRVIDFCMVAALLFLMSYALVGEAAHEALGCTMFAFMLAHIVLNFSWYRTLWKGRYSVIRTVLTVLDFLILAGMIASLVSGMRLSRHIFPPLGLTYNVSVARIVHLLASYWGFCLMSMHLGMHWNIISASITKRKEKSSGSITGIRLIRYGVVFALAAYGLFVFISRGLWRYMFLITRFVFLDFDEPLPFFIADYIAIMVLFAFWVFSLAKAIPKAFTQKSNKVIPGIVQIT